MDEHASWVTHTHTVIGKSHALRATLLEAESSRRGYALAGRAEDLTHFSQALERVLPTLDELTALTGDNPAQHARIIELRAALAPRLAAMRGTPRLREGNDGDPGPVLGDDLRTLLAEVEAEERALLSVRGARSATSRREAVWAVSAETIVGIGLLVAAAALARRDARGRARAADAQRRAGAELERRVQERTAELTATTHQFRREVEERRAAEAALRVSEARFAAFMDHMPAVTWVKDPDGRTVYANRAFELLNGLPPAGWSGRTDHDLYPPGDAAEYLRTDREVLADGRPQELTGWRGAKMWWSIKFALPGTDGQRFVGGIAFDVTARTRAEAALRATEARYRAVVESAFDAIVTTDRSGTIVGWNAGAARMFDRPAAEAVGQSAVLLAPDRFVAAHAGALAAFDPDREAGVFGRVIEFVARRGREEFPVEITLTHWVVDSASYFSAIIRDVTERVRADERLRDSRERFEAAFDRAAIGMALVARDGRFLKVNPALCEMLGYTAADLLATTSQGITHPDDVATTLAEVRRLLAGEATRFELEKRYVHKSGAIVWGSLTMAAVPAPDGGVGYFVSQVQNVTARKQAEETLRASEARYRALVEATDQFVWSWSPERGTGDFARQQRLWENLTGQSPADQGGDHRGWLAVVHPDDRDRVGALWSRALESGTDYALEYRVRARAGGWRHIQSRGVAVRHPNGTLSEWVGALSDVTEQRAAEFALRESEERFRQMADAIDQVFWLDEPATGEVLYVSPAFEKVWGFSGDVLRSRPSAWIEAVHPDDRPIVEAKVHRGREGERWAVEYRIIKPDGSVRWVRDAGFPVCGADGRVQRMAGVARDVTDRRQLEEQFRQSQKMEAIGQLAGGVAHDFNNLLTIINGYSDLLLSQNPSGEAHDLLTDISEAGQRAAGLTRQLLAFSRRQALRPRVTDLNVLVANLGRMLERLIGEDIRLIKDLYPDLGRVSIDPGQIEQVIVNLAVNARDAMPRGGRLTIATSEVDVDGKPLSGLSEMPAGRYAVLTVTDTGIGIPDEIRARIFDPFFTTKEVGKGTGLGLATVLGIVRQSRGHIEVESAPNDGATFRIFFPIADSPVESVAPATAPLLLTGQETILLVEDDDWVRRFASHALRSNGYTVLEAADGHTALTILATAPGPIDLLITDVIMPEMSGRSLAEQLRASDPGLRVLYISGYTDDAVVRAGVAEASAAFLQKPFSVDELRRAVRSTMDNSIASLA